MTKQDGKAAVDLLYEIGVEEIPASYIEPALTALATAVVTRLSDERLGHGAVESYATPRRFTLILRGVAARQPDIEREVLGPAVAAAYGAGGEPTNAARGFAKGQGVPVEALERVETEKGIYVQARVQKIGRPAAEVVPPILAAATRAAVIVPGLYTLGDHPDASIDPPTYGLRLNELVNATGGFDFFTFSFDHPQSNMSLVYNNAAQTIRIFGHSRSVRASAWPLWCACHAPIGVSPASVE